MVRILVGIVDAAPKASEPRARVAAFKDPLKPDLRDRLGIASYERLADLLDRRGEGDLASWVRAQLPAVALR